MDWFPKYHFVGEHKVHSVAVSTKTEPLWIRVAKKKIPNRKKFINELNRKISIEIARTYSDRAIIPIYIELSPAVSRWGLDSYNHTTSQLSMPTKSLLTCGHSFMKSRGKV